MSVVVTGNEINLPYSGLEFINFKYNKGVMCPSYIKFRLYDIQDYKSKNNCPYSIVFSNINKEGNTIPIISLVEKITSTKRSGTLLTSSFEDKNLGKIINSFKRMLPSNFYGIKFKEGKNFITYKFTMPREVIIEIDNDYSKDFSEVKVTRQGNDFRRISEFEKCYLFDIGDSIYTIDIGKIFKPNGITGDRIYIEEICSKTDKYDKVVFRHLLSKN